MSTALAVVPMYEEQVVDFHGDEITSIQDEAGNVWVPLRRLCDCLGIDVNSQRRKLQRDSKFDCCLQNCPDPRNRKRALACIRQDQIELFESTINPNKIDKSKETYIYFIQISPNGPIKIGLSNDVEKRRRNLTCAIPYDLNILGYIGGNQSLEKKLHKKFKTHYIRGEWFKPHSEILAYIRGECNR
jgi:hypothetical protein